jgi:hypothetical protein
MYEIARTIIEAASAIVCLILVWFMIKPFQLTRENRYLGLPLGFIFLCISYTIGAVAWSEPTYFFKEAIWLQLLTRTFAFVFIAMTYYFYKKHAQNTRVLWNLTLSALIVALIALSLTIFVAPQVASNSYTSMAPYVRIFNVLCLSYIAIHTLRSHIKNPDPTTIWIPQGFIFLAISQYSLLFWYTDRSYAAFWGALVLRSFALAVFLYVAYRAFYSSRTGNP